MHEPYLRTHWIGCKNLYDRPRLKTEVGAEYTFGLNSWNTYYPWFTRAQRTCLTGVQEIDSARNFVPTQHWLAAANPGRRNLMAQRLIHVPRSLRGLEDARVMPQMVFHEARDEVVAVIIAVMTAQLELHPSIVAGCRKKMRV